MPLRSALSGKTISRCRGGRNQALVHVLLKDKAFAVLSEQEKKMVTGRILENIILLETTKVLSSRYKVCKFQFASDEFDMVIYDCEENCCAAFKIKHSSKAAPEQARHLRDAEKCACPAALWRSGWEICALPRRRDGRWGRGRKSSVVYVVISIDVQFPSKNLWHL